MRELIKTEIECVNGGVPPWFPPGYTPPIGPSREETERLLEQLRDLLDRQNSMPQF